MIDALRHIAIHLAMSFLQYPIEFIAQKNVDWPIGAGFSVGWAIGTEFGDLVKKWEDPEKHPEGFSWIDLFFRFVGAGIAFGIMLWI